MRLLNQILSIENTSKSKATKKHRSSGGPLEVKAIVRFFAICLIVFGVFVTGSGSYSMYKYAKSNSFGSKNSGSRRAEEKDIVISFTPDGNNMKIKAVGKNELSYLTYRWDEEEEVRIDINDVLIEEKIEIPKGLHTLTVIVVDINNVSETKTQEVKGVTKPKVEVTTDGADNFIIIATDEEGLSKIEFIINEDEKYLLNLDGRTELEYAYPLHEGENRLEIRVYNVNDISETARVMLTK